jgi:hypothetical protein
MKIIGFLKKNFVKITKIYDFLKFLNKKNWWCPQQQTTSFQKVQLDQNVHIDCNGNSL